MGLCEKQELCLRNIGRPEQEAEEQERRQVDFAVPDWETAMSSL